MPPKKRKGIIEEEVNPFAIDEVLEDEETTHTQKRKPKLTDAMLPDGFFGVDAYYDGKSKCSEVYWPIIPDSNLPSNIASSGEIETQVQLLNKMENEKGLPPHTFIVGHLINERLHYVASELNFVPLTTVANGNHSDRVEERIFAFLTSLNNESGDEFRQPVSSSKNTKSYLALHYKVTSSESFWPAYEELELYTCVPDEITCEIKFVIYDVPGRSREYAAQTPHEHNAIKKFVKKAKPQKYLNWPKSFNHWIFKIENTYSQYDTTASLP